MFIRKYKAELLPNLEYWHSRIMTHWVGHRRPYWTDLWEKRVTKNNRNDLEFIVATTWITQGAKGCSCYKKSPVLQDAVANYFMTKGAVEACDVIINETLKNGNFDPNLPNTKPRKLLLI